MMYRIFTRKEAEGEGRKKKEKNLLLILLPFLAYIGKAKFRIHYQIFIL